MKYDCLILGASFYGCGIAAGLGGNVLVLEESAVPGSDWALGFDAGCWDATLTLPQAVSFRDSLTAHKALTEDGRLCIAALAPLMAEWCKANNVNIEFSCSVLDFSETGVDAVGVQGRAHYDAGLVVDARPKTIGGRKYATGVVLSSVPIPAGPCGDFIVTPSGVAGEYYLALPLAGDVDWHGARSAFHRAWDRRPASMGAGLLQLIGTRFSYCNAPNPAAAIEYGYLWARDVLKK